MYAMASSASSSHKFIKKIINTVNNSFIGKTNANVFSNVVKKVRTLDYDSLWEAGVSVFEESNGLPIIKNEEQARSLKNRIGYAIYIVEGERVGTGEDGEPLLRIETATQINIDNSVLESIVEVLL
jgi:hypothetical protein